MIKLPSQERLKTVLDYDASSGAISRKLPIKMRGVGTHKDGKGYVIVRIDGRSYRAHRVIWKMVNGVDPLEIDHINGEKADNRLCNLRNVPHGMNTKNAKKWRNKDLPKGVRRHLSCNKYEARIRVDRKQIYLGLFFTPELAHAAYREAAVKYHKEFARFE